MFADEILKNGMIQGLQVSLKYEYSKTMYDNSIDWKMESALPFKISEMINQSKLDLKELNINESEIFKLEEICFVRYLKTNRWTYYISLMNDALCSITLPYCLTRTPQKHFGKIDSLDINAFNNTLDKASTSKNLAWIQKGNAKIANENVVYAYELHNHKDKIFQTPSWDPNNEDIPLTIKEACNERLKDLLNKNINISNFVITDISIKRYGNSDKWYFFLKYDNYDTGECICSLILFSGEALPPDQIIKTKEKGNPPLKGVQPDAQAH